MLCQSFKASGGTVSNKLFKLTDTLKKTGKGEITQQKFFFRKIINMLLNRYIRNVIYQFQNSTVIN